MSAFTASTGQDATTVFTVGVIGFAKLTKVASEQYRKKETDSSRPEENRGRSPANSLSNVCLINHPLSKIKKPSLAAIALMIRKEQHPLPA
jgi:hypothetical protein